MKLQIWRFFFLAGETCRGEQTGCENATTALSVMLQIGILAIHDHRRQTPETNRLVQQRTPIGCVGLDRLSSKIGGRRAAFDTQTGRRLWDRPAVHKTRPLINGDVIYAEGGAWEIRRMSPAGPGSARTRAPSNCLTRASACSGVAAPQASVRKPWIVTHGDLGMAQACTGCLAQRFGYGHSDLTRSTVRSTSTCPPSGPTVLLSAMAL